MKTFYLFSILTLALFNPLFAAPTKIAPGGSPARSKEMAFSFGAEAFKSGDRVCWVGDSITHGGSYHSQIQLFYTTRFPQLEITYFNCGIGGDRAGNIMGRAPYRFTNDILRHQPTVATIMLGMNDVEHRVYKDPNISNVEARKISALAVYETNMQALLVGLQAAGSRVILLTPSIYDETALISNETRPLSKGVSRALKHAADSMKQWSLKYKTGIVDFQERMLAANAIYQKMDPTNTIVGKDRVHPGPLGHLIMAYGFLKDTGMPSLVSRMSLDGRKGVVEKDNTQCTLSQIKSTKDGLTFECLENALPFPITEGARGALELIPFMNDLNRELLAVKNLAKGQYKIEIDGVSVGTWDEKALQAGVNLAGLTNTPQYRQSHEIMKSNEQRMALVSGQRNLVAIEYGVMAPKGIDPSAEPEKAKALLEKLIEDAMKKDPKSVKGDWKAWLDTEKRQKNADAIRALEAYIQKAKIPVSHKYTVAKLK